MNDSKRDKNDSEDHTEGKEDSTLLAARHPQPYFVCTTGLATLRGWAGNSYVLRVVGWAHSRHISGTLLPGSSSSPEQENKPLNQKNRTRKKWQENKTNKNDQKINLFISGLFAILLLMLK